jgi:hypothetical protein
MTIFATVLMYPLNIVPYGVPLPAVALTLIAIGIMHNDGLSILVGLGFTLAAMWVTWFALSG